MSSERDPGGLVIKVPVKVMAVVTEELRQQLARECQDHLRKLDFEMEQLSAQVRRLQGERTGDTEMTRKLLDDKAQRERQRQQWRDRLKEIAQVPLDTLLLQGTAEGFVQVAPGMHWSELQGARIVIRDGVVLTAAMGSGEEAVCDR